MRARWRWIDTQWFYVFSIRTGTLHGKSRTLMLRYVATKWPPNTRIYIPIPFQLTERPSRCSAEICKCQQGREHIAKKEKAKFSLIYCQFCGSSGIHRHCSKSRKFECKECLDLSNRVTDSAHVENGRSTQESDNAEHDLGAENMRRIAVPTGSDDNAECSNSTNTSSSSSIELVSIDRFDFDRSLVDSSKNDGDEDGEVLVQTKTSSCSSNTSISANAVYNSEVSDSEDDHCIRAVGLNRSFCIFSDDEDDSNIDSILTETASESTQLQLPPDPLGISSEDIANYNMTMANDDHDSDDEDRIKPVVLTSSNKIRTRIYSSSSSSADSTASTSRSCSKRTQSMAFRDTITDDESLIENQNAMKPSKKNKLNQINNNNASTPLLEDNKNKWNRPKVVIS